MCFFTIANFKKHATMLMIDASAAPETNSSLQYHLCGLGNRELDSDTTLQLSGGVHHLEEGPFCVLQNLENITIQGQQTQPRTVIYCHSETEMRRGIAFFNISSFHLSHLEIINCGREVPTGLPGHVNNTVSYLGSLQKAVMIITHSTILIVDSVDFERCLGFAMLFINPSGQTMISNASITGTNSQGLSQCTQPLERRDMLCSGSGFVFIFNDTDITEELVKGDNHTVFLTLMNCYFFNNTNMISTHVLEESLRVLAAGSVTERIPMSGGFSIALAMAQKGYFVDVKFINTVIFSNTGNVGNIIVMYYNMIKKSRIVLNDVLLKYNKAVGINSRAGGVAVVGVIFQDSLGSFQHSNEDIHDLIEVVNSQFTGNSAFYGGGIQVFMTPQNVSDVRVVVRDTTFTNNVAIIGPAMHAFHFQSLIDHKGVYIYLEDIVASGNTFPAAEVSETSPKNTGVFVVSHSSNISVVGTAGKGCHFHNNTVSAIIAVSTNLVLRGWITFERNRGFRGGALSLIGTSILFIHNESTISFLRNKAFREGGAIYINLPGSFISFTCAIQFLGERRIKIFHENFQLLNLSMTFSNNSAEIAGNSIFGNPLYFCAFIPITAIDNSQSLNANHAILYNKVFQFQDTVGNKLSELNSVQEIICICQSIIFEDCPPHHVLDHTVIPGDSFALHLNPVDAARVPVASFLYSFLRSANSSDPASLDSHQDIRPLPGLSHNCSLLEFTVFAPQNITVYIDLFANIGRQRVTVELNTAFCPPGFVLGSSSTDKKMCLCSDFIKSSLKSTCNMTDYTIARPTNYWVGTRSEDSGDQIVQFVSTCPTDYCREEVTDIDLRVPDQLCAEGRTGTLCGACREGLSSVFGTAECQKCSNAWLAIILLLALLGIVIVISGLLLDLTITHGLINGPLFYCYIVMVNSNIFLRRNKSGFLFWFLSWMNIDSGYPVCFYDGMTEPAKLGLQYVFPAYIIFMIVFIIVLGQYSLAMQRILSHLDGIHMLATMLYISFLKLFRTVIDTFTFVTIVSENGDREDVVWFFDGTLEASHPISVILILLGTPTMVGFILHYVVFFTFSTYIQRWVNSTRLNAFVDASLAPYKEELRFWFGARLILTSIIYVIIANRGTNNPAITLTLEISLLVGFAIIQAYIHPFKNIGVAILDMSFLLNLIALSLGTLYTIQNYNPMLSDQQILAKTFVSITLIMYIVIIVWHLWKRLSVSKKIKTKTDQMLATVTRLLLALKLKIKREIVVKRKGESGSGSEQGAATVLQSGLKLTAYSEATTGTTTISLQDMVAAPDNEEPTLSQLREPVLDLVVTD